MSSCLDENAALELIEGRLSSTARMALERHLEACNPCRELVAELAKVVGDDERSVDTERTPLGAQAPLTPGSHAGPYLVQQAIGQGSAGTVHRAVDERTGQVVALKLVTDPALRARFSREATTLARLEHDAIVRYVGHGEMPGGLYLAMEWLEGEDLAQCLARGPIGWRRARVLGLRIASALSYAHAHGCVHRDLSPRNVFLTGGLVERAKLLDFGLVRVQDSELARTTSQAVLGTPFYMAPEQVRDPKNVDGRADLFGLGVLLYEAVSGVRPFEGEDLFSVWVKIVDLPAPDLRRAGPAGREPVPEAFVRLVEALLAKDPGARPHTADEVGRLLHACDAPPTMAAPAPAPLPVPTLAPGPPLPARSLPPALASSEAPPRSSGVWVIGALGAVLVGVLGAAGGLVYAYGSALRARIDQGRAAPPVSATSEPAPSPSPPPTATPLPKANPNARVDPAHAAPENYFCGGDTVETRRGGHYEPPPGSLAAIAEAVTVAGSCKLTLEDCLIGGPHSVQVLGDASLVLRRCQVRGEVKAVGEVTLQLENTTLAHPPVVVGKAKVIRH